MLANFFKYNRKFCNLFDTLLPNTFIKDGYNEFSNKIVPRFLKQNLIVYDIGGGKHPHFSPHEKKQFNLNIIGIDISKSELEQAPDGCYDSTLAVDITKHRGFSDGDLIICKALLEHVEDTHKAILSLSSIVGKHGKVLLFIPSRNAIFARINLLLPEKFKQMLLFFFFPKTRYLQGFKAYYDKCTPRGMSQLCDECGLEVLELKPYFKSGYFSFFFPLHLCWRLWIIFFRVFAGTNAAESFVMVLGKKKVINA
jgi:2-polyprenyl-6-hydroxyphenyl methylase/3-demethylubiquinone-9 3-methyltransferase